MEWESEEDIGPGLVRLGQFFTEFLKQSEEMRKINDVDVKVDLNFDPSELILTLLNSIKIDVSIGQKQILKKSVND